MGTWEGESPGDGLHLLFGESNQNEYAYALKVGTTLIALRLLEDQLVWTLEPSFELGIQQGRNSTLNSYLEKLLYLVILLLAGLSGWFVVRGARNKARLNQYEQLLQGIDDVANAEKMRVYAREGERALEALALPEPGADDLLEPEKRHAVRGFAEVGPLHQAGEMSDGHDAQGHHQQGRQKGHEHHDLERAPQPMQSPHRASLRAHLRVAQE